MKFSRKTLVVRNDDSRAEPITLGTLAEAHFNAAADDDEPISVESAWQYAIDEIRLGSYRIVEASRENAPPEPPADRAASGTIRGETGPERTPGERRTG